MLGLCDMREVAATMGTHYPNMFRVAKPGRDRQGFQPNIKVPSLNELASNIIDRVRSSISEEQCCTFCYLVPIQKEEEGWRRL